MTPRQSRDANAGGSTGLSTSVIASLCGIAIVFVIALVVIFRLCRPKAETQREEQNLMAGLLEQAIQNNDGLRRHEEELWL
jgi:hypothetical protein